MEPEQCQMHYPFTIPLTQHQDLLNALGGPKAIPEGQWGHVPLMPCGKGRESKESPEPGLTPTRMLNGATPAWVLGV